MAIQSIPRRIEASVERYIANGNKSITRRRYIVKQAIDMGLDEDEINSYIDEKEKEAESIAEQNKPKKFIPDELDALLQEYLTDGYISDAERKVLLNKASKMGLDVDEFDLYITAQQQKADQAFEMAARKRRGQTCPFCGGPVPQLVDKCPHCGQLITAEASKELKEIIEKLDESLVELKKSYSVTSFNRNRGEADKYLRSAKLFYSNNPKIKILIEEVTNEIESVGKRLSKEEENEEKKERNEKLLGLGMAFGGIFLMLIMYLIIS